MTKYRISQTEDAKLQRELVRRGAEAAGQSIVDHAKKRRGSKK